ncbi:hypothetical protein L207DRAFT_583046 [Hyaloscypha variabilis F]|uniref:Uncharacterized protein n=1 Tax=Hyaloscypha variabilis (strain UAMH 11265 / GT02V1 / F) TaxID=1149755 RepID=A0A2J6RQT9_HYAVF|nr:hypothetical protein L207DRAFT_583046 [Hyaloscypha variabilis F]
MPTLYESTISVFIRQLTILSSLLKHGITHAASPTNTLTESSLIDARLIADMQTLAYQIQRVSDTSKGFAVRVGKIEPVPFEDNEKTFEELLERIAKTVRFLEGVKEEDINKNEEEEVVLKTGTGEMKFSAKNYALNWAIPNFYFHFVTAYDILRAQGVPIGKANYLGRN